MFTYKVWWGNVLTMDQLKKRGLQLAIKCPLCKEDEENIDHLHCPSIWSFWVALISLPGIDWVCPFLVKNLMVGWTTFPKRRKAKNQWQAALSSLFFLWIKANIFIKKRAPRSNPKYKGSIQKGPQMGAKEKKKERKKNYTHHTSSTT